VLVGRERSAVGRFDCDRGGLHAKFRLLPEERAPAAQKRRF
jgi:hypothetical protein